MAEQHHNPHHPLVGQVGEHDQECRQWVMKDILIVVALLVDEHMRDESAEVFAELEQIDDFHTVGSLGKSWGIFDDV